MERKFSQIAMEFVGEREELSPQTETLMEADPVVREEKVSPIKEQDPVATDQRPKKSLSKRGRPSLKEMDINADLVQIPPDEILFQKQYYSIGEVAKWFRVNQSLVRYWET